MAKRIDWTPIREDYFKGIKGRTLAAKHGISERSLERQMSKEGWANLAQAGQVQNVVPFAAPQKEREAIAQPAQSAQPGPRRRPVPAGEELDLRELLASAIQSMSGYASGGGEAPTSDRAASAMARLIETYRKHYPPTIDEAVDWIVGLPDFDPHEFAKKLKQRWLETRAG